HGARLARLLSARLRTRHASRCRAVAAAGLQRRRAERAAHARGGAHGGAAPAGVPDRGGVANGREAAQGVITVDQIRIAAAPDRVFAAAADVEQWPRILA